MNETRPRSKSTFSFRSNKSDKSASKQRMDLTETESEKRAAQMSNATKANPNSAITEAQPIGVAQAAMTMAPMRTMQYKDQNGNVIVDPDWSNPSRPRLERPLDTIRSFEAAIDNSHRRRSNIVRSESENTHNAMASRRSSYQSTDFPHNQRYSPAGGHGSRVGSYRQGHDNYANYGSNSPGYSQRRTPTQRMQANNRMSSDYGVYPIQGYQDSYDTVHTGESSGSQSTDMYGNSTDPSSENSSIDRMHPMGSKPENDAYGPGIGRRSPMHGAIMEEYGSQHEQYGYGAGYHQGHGPVTPQQYEQRAPLAPAHLQAPPQPRPLIKLGGDSTLSNSSGNTAKYYEPPSREKEKKGFFKKRFSKN